MSPSNSSSNEYRTINTDVIRKKIEAGEHYFTAEEIDAIWWDGYERGSLDSAYTSFDQGYASAIDDYDLYWNGQQE